MRLKMDPSSNQAGEIIIYSLDGNPQFEVKVERETVWLTQAQMAELFSKDVRTISEHIQNIFKERELEQNSVIRNFRITAADGKTYLTNYYNLDLIISVGYRVNSKRGIQFRIWATSVLRDHLLKGFTINVKRLKENQQVRLRELQHTVTLFQQAIKTRELAKDEMMGLLSVITDYTNTWLLLHEYDEDKIHLKKSSKKAQTISYEETKNAIIALKKNLTEKKEASSLFGKERERGLDRILKAVSQTFDGKGLYPSIEEKASHLLYFIIKDHPFVDGNKRIGAFLFILFLSRNNYLFRRNGERKINDNTLVALALLIAESKPGEKEIMISLITNLVFFR